MGTGRKAIDLTGMKFGRLTVIERSGTYVSINTPTSKIPMWLCRCDCGTTVEVMGGNLKKGNTRSCGCLRTENARRMTALTKKEKDNG